MVETAQKLAADPNLVTVMLLIGIAALAGALIWVVKTWREDVKEMQADWKSAMDSVAEANDKVADALNAINLSVARIQGAVGGRS